MLVCRNKECEAYKNNSCKRANKFKIFIESGWKNVSSDKLIHKRYTKDKCEFYIEEEKV